MAKITFLGAGSSVFAKNILGDAMLVPALSDAHIALYDINSERLSESKLMLDVLNKNINQGRATITAHLGQRNRKAALSGAAYVVNAIQVGGYKPSTVIDFEVPKKYGLRQTIADTLGIGGIFRTLRTLPVMWEFARDMEEVCPEAQFINYTNPMCMLVMGMTWATPIRTVGLCHSVQSCVPHLLAEWGVNHPRRDSKGLRWKIAGINHQAWLLEITDHGKDLYPSIRKLAAAKNAAAKKKGGKKHWDMVRYEFMRHFGYYITESSEHSSEYMPYWIKSNHPELIEQLNIPLDEYPRRCINQIANWKKQRNELLKDPTLSHERSHEYGSYIMEAMETGNPIRIHGNVLNGGSITNLPRNCSVEVPCLVDRNGVQPIRVGDIPEHLAGINRTNVNVQIVTVEAAMTRKRDAIYHAAYLDPHTSSELTLDQIRDLCDDLITAHGKMLPKYR